MLSTGRHPLLRPLPRKPALLRARLAPLAPRRLLLVERALPHLPLDGGLLLARGADALEPGPLLLPLARVGAVQLAAGLALQRPPLHGPVGLVDVPRGGAGEVDGAGVDGRLVGVVGLEGGLLGRRAGRVGLGVELGHGFFALLVARFMLEF